MSAPAKTISEKLIGALRGALTGASLAFRVDTTPSPACRPRVTRTGHAYYAKGFQVHMADCLKQLSAQKPAEPLQGDLAALVEVLIERPKKTIRVRPPGDADNLGKAVLDAGTKAGVWADDGQITALFITKRWADPGEAPGIRMAVSQI